MDLLIAAFQTNQLSLYMMNKIQQNFDVFYICLKQARTQGDSPQKQVHIQNINMKYESSKIEC